MAKTSRSPTSYSITVSSMPPTQGGMTAWELRDFVRELDAQDIPDGAEIIAEHAHQTRHFIGLRVRYDVIVEPAEGEA